MLEALTPAQLGIPGGPELLVILLIAVLLFGANKIPQLARSSGEALGEFKKGREEVEQELSEMREGKSAGDEDSDRTETAATSADESTASADESTASADESTTEDRADAEEETRN